MPSKIPSWKKFRDKYNEQRRLKYKQDKAYRELRKLQAKKYREIHSKEEYIRKKLWELKNSHKIKRTNRKRTYNNFENTSDYMVHWREQNKKYVLLSDRIKRLIGTTLPIQVIRDNYDELKKQIEIK